MAKKLNILVYLSDQQRHDSMGCYGQKLNTSPVADALAREGVLFENAYTCQPVCGPARACLQTGTYPTINGCHHNAIGLRADETTIAKELDKIGYDTAYIGKWHLSSDFANGIIMVGKPIPPERMGGYKYYVSSEALETTSHGYDGYMFNHNGNRCDFVGYRTDCVTNYAIQYLHNRQADKPFFLFVSHIEPHQQNDHGCFEGPDGSKEKFKDYDVPPDLVNGKFEGDWKENYADYLGQCRALDDNLGKLIDTLKETGEYENTVIIYSSDHGCHFRTQDGEYKRNCFDSCLHIPLIIAGGPFKGGLRCNRLVSNIQLPTTILSLAQAPIPEKMVYEPLQMALDPDCPFGDHVFYQITETELARGIRTAKWKYCVGAPHKQPVMSMEKEYMMGSYHDMMRRSKPDSDSYIEKYLFDLEADPYEKENLVDDDRYMEERKMLSETLIKSMVRAGEAAPAIYPAGTPLPKEYDF